MARRSATALTTGTLLATLFLLTSCSQPSPTEVGNPESELAEVRRHSSRWQQLSAPGTGPTGIKAVAHAPSLRAVFVASVLDFQPGELWRFDLKRDEWTRLTAASWPIGKYRKLIHDPVRRRLLTYWDGLGQVYSIPDTGGAWTPEGTTGNREEFYEAYAFFDPIASRLTVFGGYGLFSWRNTLWGWDASAQWQELPQGSVVPAPRFGPANAVTVDRRRKRAYIMGRIGDTNWDDLWQFDLVTRQWKELIPAITGPALVQGAGLVVARHTGTLYRFGGLQLTTGTFTNALQFARPDDAVVEWTTIPVTGAAPSPRGSSHLVHDQPRNRVIVVSGAISGAPDYWINDVWAYRLP